MASKGFDLSRAVPKAVIQVPNLDHLHVIVLLAPEAKRAFPRKPRKAVLLDWLVDDPSAVKGSEAQVAAAYEQTYSFIESHLRDLMSAIRDISSV
jgi:protein-tyrosine-phosphatase